MTGRLENGEAWANVRPGGRAGPRAAAPRFVLTLVAMAGLVSLAVLPGRPARGQDDWDAGKRQANQRDIEEEAGFRGAVMGQEDFDRWAFEGKTRQQIEQTLVELLATQVESVARACTLSDAQKRKLELAGRGDVKRFSRSVDQVKEKFRQVGQDQQKFNDIAREVFPLQLKMQTGVFGESSLYRKILKQTLDREQSDRYEQQERQRRKFRYEARIELVLSNLEAAIPLRAEQRQQLVKLLVDETEPPKVFGQYDYYAVLYQASKLGEAKFKSILDDAQWQTLKRAIDQSKGVERHLQAGGVGFF